MYVIFKLQFGIECRENIPMAEWCAIPPGSCVPFWPTSGGSSKKVVASIGGTHLESQPFDITESHATFLLLCHEVILLVCVCFCSYFKVLCSAQHVCYISCYNNNNNNNNNKCELI